MRTVKRALARLVYESGPVCFKCGTRVLPCAGHEWLGTITARRLRRFTRFVPAWAFWWIDPRWDWL